MEEDEASIPALQDKLRKAEQKNALLERNQKMLHEKMANIDELITKFTAVNAQLKQKSQRLAHSQQEIEQLKRQLAEASAAAASYSQSLRAKTVELEATKTAMSETLQENEALMCEKSSMQALNAQLSAEIEGGSRWIDEQRAMHKELSRVRRELSYEKTRYTARAKEAVDLTLEVRKQTNENIEAREELRGLKALVKQLEVVLAERGMESVYGEAVEEVQRQQALEKKLREERELQAARLAEKRRLERELRAETFVPYSDHDHDHGDDDGEGAEANASLDLYGSAGDTAGDANATKEKERQKKNEKEKKNEEDGRDLEQLLSQEIDRAMSGDGAAAATQPADTPPSGRGKGRGGRQAKDSSSAVGRLSKAMADTPAKRGRGRGRASTAKLNATGPSPSTDTSESASPGAKGTAGGRRLGEARGRGRGRGRGEKRKAEPSPREVVREEGPMPKRKRTASVAAGASSGGEPMAEGHGEDESFDEFASFLETAFDDDTEEALAARPAPPAATANVVPTPPRDAMASQANVGEEHSATAPITGATTTTAAAALEMVHEMMMADTSLPATPITPLPSTPVALSSCPSTPIRYSSFPPPSPVRQVSSSSFPSYSSSSASSTPPAATPPSLSPSTRSPSTPASSSSVVSSPSSPSASLRRTSQLEFEPSLFSESEQEDNADDDHQMDVPTLLRPAIDDQQQPRPADAVAASETRPSLTAPLESELAATPRPAVDERPSELEEKREDEDQEGKAKAKEREKRQEEERKREDEERQRREREREEREERDRREKEKEREEEEKRQREAAAAAEQERRAKEELERRKKEAEEKEEEAKRMKAKEEEAKRRAREAEELRAQEEESERRRKQELHEKQERERIAAEEKEKEKKENEAKERKERETAEKAKAKEAKGKEKERRSSTDEKNEATEATEATEAKRAEGEREGKRETKRKREDHDAARPPSVAVAVERSRRPRELQQLLLEAREALTISSDFSRRVEQLGGGEGTKGVVVEELAEDFSDDKNIKEADLLSCLEGLVRKGRPATSPRKPTPKPKRAKQPTVDGESPQLLMGEGEGEEQEKWEKEQEALLADLVWRVDGLRQRRQADEKAGRLKRPAEKRSTKRLTEQMVLRLETGLCRGEIAPATDGRQGFGAAEARMVRLLVGLGRRLSEEAGDARTRGEEEMRTWRVLVHHFTACLGAWRGWRDRLAAAADDSNDEGPKAIAAFIEMLDDVAALWSDAMRIDTTADHAHDHDQHDVRRRKKEAMGIVYRVVVLLLDEVTTSTPGQEAGQLKQRWHGVRERCGWDAIGAVDENALLAEIMGYCRALGRHRDEDACKWDDETALVLRSMELLALCKGWDWTYQVLVNHVWPMLSETAPDEGHTSVAAALRLIGLMSRRAFGDSPTGHPLRESQRDKVEWLSSTLDMVIAPPPPSLDDGAPPIPVFSFRCQLAAVESLRDLFSPTDDGASLVGAKAWLASLSVEQRKRVPVALKKALA